MSWPATASQRVCPATDRTVARTTYENEGGLYAQELESGLSPSSCVLSVPRALAKVVTVELTSDCLLVTVTNCPYNDVMSETFALWRTTPPPSPSGKFSCPLEEAEPVHGNETAQGTRLGRQLHKMCG